MERGQRRRNQVTFRHKALGPGDEGMKVHVDGSFRWYDQSGALHREDGPAIELKDGTRMWWRNGQLHREDGPAVEGADGRLQWWLENHELSKEEWRTALKSRALAAVTVIPGQRVRCSALSS